jgi:hypothetical protein
VGWHSANVIERMGLVAVLCCISACGPTEENGVLGSVELGDNFVAPDLALDEDFFYCRIQPNVLAKHGCASGQSGESGRCHDSQSALRLIDTSETVACDDDDRVTGELPDSFAANFDAARFFVQTDPLTSPLYLRPLRKASHPRRIFDEDNEAADLIVEWISQGAR